MVLYKNKEVFVDAINAASRSLKINESLIEKDYFVIYILSELNKEIPGLLFKGGTCCSHAYKVIDRFSEDIDLSLDVSHFGRNHNIKANKSIIAVCERLGFRIINKESVEKHSHGNFNRYYVEYPITFPSRFVKPYIQIEMAFYQKSYPDEIKLVNSILGQWMNENKNNILVQEFELPSFNICVQKLERTFIDKVFAICDYYERKESTRNSRHIYDLYKISKVIDVSRNSFKELISEVRNDRKKNGRCISAKDGYDINLTLQKIIDSKYFERDYIEVTMLLLTKQIKYDTAIQAINKIIKFNIF